MVSEILQSKTKTCQNCEQNFVIEPEDFEFYQKIDVPEPTFCPECRMIRRAAFKNDWSLHKRKDDFDKKDIIATFSPNSLVKAYDPKHWYSDAWDQMSTGRDYDFNKSFLIQFRELLKEAPIMARAVANLENSEYVMNANDLKNCYLLYGSAYCEDCAYLYRSYHNKDCYDICLTDKCELCYKDLMTNNCYKAFFSAYCDDCQEIYFCRNCVGCSNCFGCVNLKHKKYHIFNKSYSKKEYEQKITEFKLGSYQNIINLRKQTQEHFLKYPIKFMYGRKNNNVTGEYIYNSKNIKNSYIVKGGEELNYCQVVDSKGAKDCYDYLSFGLNANLVYETVASGLNINKVFFSASCCIDCRNIEYSYECYSSSDLFGCVGLRNKKYCILNKQYTKKEYEELVPKIKKHMNDMPYTDKEGIIYKYGEFFPVEFSPFEYNESMAQFFFPLSKEKALERGYRWYDKPKPEYQATLKAQDIKDNIKDTDDSILKEVIECSNEPNHTCQGSGVFRLIKPEYDFYQKHNLPIPRLCPDCRRWKTLRQMNPMKLYYRQCQCVGEKDKTGIYQNQSEHSHKSKPCPNEFETTYAPERPEIVYCEECYQREVE